MLLLALRPPLSALSVAVLAAVLYVDGHGIHLAANSIARESPVGEAEDVAHFWDERFGHIEWHLGWIGLIGAMCLADATRGVRLSTRLRTAVALLLGVTFFTNTVEGGTWWLELAAAGFFAAWAARERRPLLVTMAVAFAVAAALIGAWAAWQGGVPQFSEAGLI